MMRFRSGHAQLLSGTSYAKSPCALPDDSSAQHLIPQFVFAAFIISLAFDSIDLGHFHTLGGINLAPSKLLGVILFLSALTSPRTLLFRVSHHVWLISVYALIGLGVAFLRPEVVSANRLLTIPQNIVLVIISVNLLRSEKNWIWFWRALLIGVALAAWLQVLRIGVSESDLAAEYVPGFGQLDRTSAMGEDANLAACFRSLGLVTGIMFLLGSIPGSRLWKIVGVVCAVGTVLAINETGSRGGVLAAAVGLLSIMFLRLRGASRLMQLAIPIIAMLFMAGLVIQSPIFNTRLERTLTIGDTANRVDIYTACIELFRASPIVGFGHVVHAQVVGEFFGREDVATHNLFLAVLLSSGLVGLIPFLWSILLLLINTFRFRHIAYCGASFVLLTCALAAGIGLNVEAKKWFWLAISAAIASDELVRQHKATCFPSKSFRNSKPAV